MARPSGTAALVFTLLVLLSTTTLPIAANADPATAAADRNAGKVKGSGQSLEGDCKGKGRGNLCSCREEGYVEPSLGNNFTMSRLAKDLSRCLDISAFQNQK